MRAVICDDDRILRGVISRVVTDAGFHVVAEAEDADEALSQVERFDADVLVTDLALRFGNGEALIKRLREVHPTTQAVVFSAYTDRHSDLYAAGASVVVAKPDFSELEDSLRNLRPRVAIGSPGHERRRKDRLPQVLPEPWAIGPGRLEPYQSLLRCADDLVPGDAALAIDVLHAEALLRQHGSGFLLAHRLEAARVAGGLLRDHDRIAVNDECHTVMLLTAAHPEAPTSVFRRIEMGWDRHGGPGILVGSFSHVREKERPGLVIDRVLAMIREGDVSASRPLRFG
jgi:DNA-binding NarL/FixJ family response regulator